MYSKEAVIYLLFSIGSLIGILVMKHILKNKYLSDDNILVNVIYFLMFSGFSLINYLLMFIFWITREVISFEFNNQENIIITLLSCLIYIIFGIYWVVLNFYLGFWLGKVIDNIKIYIQGETNDDIKLKIV